MPAQNIDCGQSLEPLRRGGSNEYPQSTVLSKNKKNNVYPGKPQFYYIKVGFKGGQCFRDDGEVLIMETNGTLASVLPRDVISVHDIFISFR